MSLLPEIAIILLLVLVNGVLAMSEIAVVSSRRAVLKARAEAGSKSAAIALSLAEKPDRFLSTVQVGITLVGIVAGAYGGVAISDSLAPLLARIDFLRDASQEVAIVTVVYAITFLSILVGELVPKRVALRSPETMAAVVARPMLLLSKISAPIVWVLAGSSNAVLRLFSLEGEVKAPPTEEEISSLMAEGTSAGVFHKSERHMVEGVLRLDECPVTEIMTHRTRIVWLDIDDADEINWRKIVTSGHSHFPVCRGNPDEILGMVGVKALWANMAAGAPGSIRSNLEKPLFVPDTLSAVEVLDLFRKKKKQRALVTDEFGLVKGMVTLIDVMAAIVGELPDKGERPGEATMRRPDGSWMVDGALSIGELRRRFSLPPLPGEGEATFVTLGGFVTEQLGGMPEEGAAFRWNGWEFEVETMDRRRVAKVVMRPVSA